MENVVIRERRSRVHVRRASTLLDEQMWLLGQDIRREDGNLLIRYGCRRERDPADTTSVYVHHPDANSEMALWGFGLMFGSASQGGMFLRRYSFRPRWTQRWQFAKRLWDVEKVNRQTMPTCDSDVAKTLLRHAALWLATYEDWVASIAGIGYRRECLERWQRKQRIAADEIADEWRTVAVNVDLFV